MSDELKALIFDALEAAEGYVRAAAFLEVANPPHEHGNARRDLALVHEALSQLQRT